MPSDHELDPTRWVAEHGDILYRFALGRVRNPVLAEDLVQDTFLAAIRGADGFGGRSTERTWLVGILKHKIIDYFRTADREVATDTLEEREAPVGDYFDRKGHWKVGQSEWITSPVKAAERTEFWNVLNACIAKLNPRQRDVYTRRELEEQNAEQICQSLDISSANLWVLLHRARLQLKTCLQRNWLGEKPQPEAS